MGDKGKQVTVLKTIKVQQKAVVFFWNQSSEKSFQNESMFWMNSFGGIMGKIAANAKVLMPALHHNSDSKHSQSCLLSDTVQTKYNICLQMIQIQVLTE